MKLLDLTVEEFLNEVDSKSPAPGGGSVSALVSALGCTLARMVAHLTFGKKKYKELSDEDIEIFGKAFNEIGYDRKKLEELVDRDTEAYNLVMDAYKLPKETQVERDTRGQAIENSLKMAIKTPLDICRLSEKTLKNLKYILKYGNKNAITDLGVSAILLYSGIEGGILNVKINLSALPNSSYKEDIIKELNELVIASEEVKKEILEAVNQNL
ncbi:cyclodeaminase/cyclohydrolase family protein [uncultured Cetobacterium sp.]|uniref:cyclodeaminase/cyclohydrolase family protein n=1 Tax=uncultured Cetobacterium sp. TaxID=527638 RepID=UPI0026292DF2|nr:cyclodeaminase/cyclohydrolase family protein [uncultured Cetobacterium sp.]